MARSKKRSNRRVAWTPDASRQARLLSPTHDDWYLAGHEDQHRGLDDTNSGRQTRGGGAGRPSMLNIQGNAIGFCQPCTPPASPDPSLEEYYSSSEEEDELEGFFDEFKGKKPPHQRVTLEEQPLIKFFQEHCKTTVCPICKEKGIDSPADVQVKTTTITSWVVIKCIRPGCKFELSMNGPEKTSMNDGKNNAERMDDYALNVLYVVAMLMCGDGPSESAKILGLLGLPNGTTFESRSFKMIEDRLTPYIKEMGEQILKENIIREVEATKQLSDEDFAAWKASLDHDPHAAHAPFDPKKYPRLKAGFDAAWQQAGSRHTYDSPSGHGATFGSILRQCLMLIYKSKLCNTCRAYKRKHPEVEMDDIPDLLAHDCCRNWRGTSGAMEPQMCLEILVKLFDENHVIVEDLVCDDDSSTRRTCSWDNPTWLRNNPNKPLPMVDKKRGVGQKERPNDGRLPERIPEPHFSADTNHRCKGLTGKLIKLAMKRKGDRFTASQMDACRMGKNYRYFCYQCNEDTTDQELILMAWAVRDHHWDIHDECGDLCARKKETPEARAASKKIYQSMDDPHDQKLYDVVGTIFEKYNRLNKLQELAHGMDTNANESFNNLCTWYAPKNRVFCGSRSLQNRLYLAMGVHSLGYKGLVERLFRALGIAMTDNVGHWLDLKERQRAYKSAKEKLRVNKKKRMKKKYDRAAEFTRKHREEAYKRQGDYQSNMNVDGDGDQKPKARKKHEGPCPICGEETKRVHSTARSAQCLGNPKHPEHETWLNSEWNPGHPGHQAFKDAWYQEQARILAEKRKAAAAVAQLPNNAPDNAESRELAALLDAATRPTEDSKPAADTSMDVSQGQDNSMDVSQGQGQDVSMEEADRREDLEKYEYQPLMEEDDSSVELVETEGVWAGNEDGYIDNADLEKQMMRAEDSSESESEDEADVT